MLSILTNEGGGQILEKGCLGGRLWDPMWLGLEGLLLNIYCESGPVRVPNYLLSSILIVTLIFFLSLIEV